MTRPPGPGQVETRTRAGSTLLADLGPTRAALLASARAQAKSLLASADADALAEIERARRRADGLVAAARAAGEADAEARATHMLRHARRHAGSAVQRARHDAYDRLRYEARQATRELRRQRDYPRLHAGLAAAARTALGADAVIEEAVGGGVIAAAGRRRLDLSLDRFADASVDALGAQVSRLWRA